jgi:signal peptidase II
MLDEKSAPFSAEPADSSIGTAALRTEVREASGRPASRSSLGLMFLVAFLGLAVDQGSKSWAFGARYGLREPRALVPGLVAGVLATNEGAGAHLGGTQPMTPAICALNGLMVLGMASWWSYRQGVQWRAHDALFIGLVCAGMVGNSVDRLALGYVRDFLVTDLWPILIFNLADVFIVLGFLALLGSRGAARLGLGRARAAVPTTVGS